MKHPHPRGISAPEHVSYGEVLQSVSFEGAAIWAPRVSSQTRRRTHIHERANIAADGALELLFRGAEGLGLKKREFDAISQSARSARESHDVACSTPRYCREHSQSHIQSHIRDIDRSSHDVSVNGGDFLLRDSLATTPN